MPVTIHYRRQGKRLTACGRHTVQTKAETRDPARVTCRTCRRVVATWQRACEELTED